MKQVSRLRKIIIIACLCLLAQLGISWKLWLPIHREFPLIGAFSFLSIHYGLVMDVLLCILLTGCVISLIVYSFNRWLIGFIVSLFLLFILEDIVRFQPWVYMFCLMLLSVALMKQKWEEQNVLFVIRIILAATYFWSGVQKLNHAFTVEIFPWLMGPFGLKDFLEHHHRLAYLVPFIEIIAGVGLLFKQFQKYAGVVLIIMHLILLYVLGPFGNTWNKLIWPWNAALVCILILLIKENDYHRFVSSLKPLLKSAWFVLVVVLTCVMPAFNYLGWWDYDLSGSLYSGNNPEAIFYYLKADSNHMPASARHAQLYYQGSQGEFLMIDQWALDDLDAPVYPEERYFKRIAKQLCGRVTQQASAGLIINEKKKFTSKQYEVNISCDSLIRMK